MQRSILLDPALQLIPGFERSSTSRVRRCVGGLSFLLVGLVVASTMVFTCQGVADAAEYTGYGIRVNKIKSFEPKTGCVYLKCLVYRGGATSHERRGDPEQQTGQVPLPVGQQGRGNGA